MKKLYKCCIRNFHIDLKISKYHFYIRNLYNANWSKTSQVKQVGSESDLVKISHLINVPKNKMVLRILHKILHILLHIHINYGL